MDREKALDQVTEVQVSASEKRQIEEFEPAEAYVEFTAEVPDDMDPKEVREELIEQAQEDAKEAILRRYEEYIRNNMDEE